MEYIVAFILCAMAVLAAAGAPFALDWLMDRGLSELLYGTAYDDDEQAYCVMCGRHFSWLDEHLYWRICWAGDGNKGLIHKGCLAAAAKGGE